MSDQPTRPETPNDSSNDSSIDPGEPVKELAGFREEPLVEVMARVRRSIYRRMAVAQVTSFWWSAPFLILREFWTVLIGEVSQKRLREDK